MLFTGSRARMPLSGSYPQVLEPVVEIEVLNMSMGYAHARIDWGALDVGDAVDKVIKIRNVGNCGVTLSFNTANWDPVSAADYIHLSWDYDGSVLHPETMVMVTFTLTVESTSINFNDFSFDTIVTGIPS